MLFIAKAGLVEILDPSADRLTRSVLSRVGDWAGCSSTSPIAGKKGLCIHQNIGTEPDFL